MVDVDWPGLHGSLREVPSCHGPSQRPIGHHRARCTLMCQVSLSLLLNQGCEWQKSVKMIQAQSQNYISKSLKQVFKPVLNQMNLFIYLNLFYICFSCHNFTCNSEVALHTILLVFNGFSIDGAFLLIYQSLSFLDSRSFVFVPILRHKHKMIIVPKSRQINLF
jgi:hypothetical protein